MRKRILVVDDEQIVLDAVSRALRKTDFHIETVRSAENALELLDDTPFDAVITDLMMPGVDGLELLQRLHDSGHGALTIVLTGYPTVQTALKAKKLGAFEYVTKPFTHQELLSVVVRALRQKRGAGDRGRVPASTEQGGLIYVIPDHSWARMDPDGTARIGMSRRFAASVGDVVDMELPAVGDLLEQGRMCVLVRAEDGVEHYLHSPLSGLVVEVNEAVKDDVDLALRDPGGAGWLSRLVPRNPERELENLLPEESDRRDQEEN